MLCVAIDLDSCPEILRLARQYDCIYASAGVHPNTITAKEITTDQLVQAAASDQVIAIGETGLDYFRSQGDLTWQRARFATHIQAAKTVKKPLIIHTREAGEDVIRTLKEEKADEVGGIMHCFVDSLEIAKQAIDLNFYISFSGIITFKNAEKVRQVAKQIPLKHMLVETDSPYLAPEPYRGKPNKPAYTRYVAEKIAKLHDVSWKQVAKQTTNNFFSLFNIK